MGKEGDLWDDSALINAFEDAISKYKKMHEMEQYDSSRERGKVRGSSKEGLSTFVEGSQEYGSHPGAYDNSNAASSATTNLEETSTKPRKVDFSNGQHVDNAFQEYSDTQGSGDYYQLLKQYYELEEQRQKILQQLQSYSSWNYHSSGMQGGTSHAYQEYPASTTQYSYPDVISACCPYFGQCVVAPCFVGGTCLDKTCGKTSGQGHNGKSASPEDGDIVKTAMGAADRAISSLMTKCSEKTADKHEEQLDQSMTSETDLTVVFNAWYSAGFYTGKYLTERSAARKQHG
ncbi:hypothetical protein NMG60_11027594 [Bertholletia excelsa]